MVDWLAATVVENKRWTSRLHSLRLQADFPDFKAGQFTQLALAINGEIVSRPFSLVNAPDDPLLDFYLTEVAGGVLSPHLASLQAGDELLVAAKASGLLTLDQVPEEASQLFLLSTGTGMGPFLSMIQTSSIWQQFDKVVLVHAVRWQEELSYQDMITAIARKQAGFSYVPIVSRESSETTLPGRIPQAIENGTLEQRTGLKIRAEDSHIMLCGNPAMVQDTMDVLINDRGLRKHSRREPGHISIEKYW